MSSSGSAYVAARGSAFLARFRQALPILVGIGLFAVTVLWSFAQNASLAPQARWLAFQEEECVQPAEGGCPIRFGEPASAVLDDASVTHAWRILLVAGLERPAGASFRLQLTTPPTPYELALYAPDGSLLSAVTNDGSEEAVLAFEAAAEGEYSITVASPDGELTGDPYTLLAVLESAPEPPTAEPAATPTPTAPVLGPYAPIPTRTTATPYRLISPATGGAAR